MSRHVGRFLQNQKKKTSRAPTATPDSPFHAISCTDIRRRRVLRRAWARGDTLRVDTFRGGPGRVRGEEWEWGRRECAWHHRLCDVDGLQGLSGQHLGGLWFTCQRTAEEDKGENPGAKRGGVEP